MKDVDHCVVMGLNFEGVISGALLYIKEDFDSVDKQTVLQVLVFNFIFIFFFYIDPLGRYYPLSAFCLTQLPSNLHASEAAATQFPLIAQLPYLSFFHWFTLDS